MKIVVISDSFKGSLSSSEIAEISTQTLHRYHPDCQVVGLPVADGGEGTVDCFLEALAQEGVAVETAVSGPWGEPITAKYGRFGSRAVVEMAAAAGLPMVGDKKDPARTTTYGVGLQMLHAVEAGSTHLVLGLGGSATNDGGCGAAAALGVRFYNEAGEEFIPTGETLKDIVKIDTSLSDTRLQGVDVEVMCDINNTVCGDNGAAAVFGPQKGADSSMVQELDAGLAHLVAVCKAQLGVDVAELEGGGAAGGFGAGAVALLHAKLRAGIEVVLDMVDFSSHLEGCDLVITGEGRMDGQSLQGKVPIGVSRRAKLKNVPVVAIVGILGDGAEAVYEEGITAVFPTNRMALPFEQVISRAAEDYRATLEDVLKVQALTLGNL